jgi:hypothetical protein
VNRFKHTTPPPRLCADCGWRERYLALVQHHRLLRAELMKAVAWRRAASNGSAAYDSEDALDRAESLLDMEDGLPEDESGSGYDA